MKSNHNNINSNGNHNIINHKNGKLIPSSLKFISSCIKTASSSVRSAGASVAASISGDFRENKDQVLWSSFDRLELSPSSFKRVLLLGYSNGFQVLNIEEASNVRELVSRRDDPVIYLQMQPLPAKSEHHEGYRNSHPLLLVVACDESKSSSGLPTGRDGLVKDGYDEPQTGNLATAPRAVRFYSLRSHNYVHVLRFRSTVYMIKCSPRIVAVGLASQVVVKDFVSRAVISQFRAHTSPISALCFDPSGTLLVTASIHGNNINVFRILPFSKHRTSTVSQNYDWSSSHVHLYKLHRGMTSAVIQDICFSNYSQWIAIVTSRGTCHIFVLAPFGGETVLQIQNSNLDGPSLTPVLSLPWWSGPSFMTNQHLFPSPPPAPVTLSVVSRIKINNSGWLNTVSNAASSAAGRASIPSGAVAAVFHSSVSQDLQPAHLKVNVLEHLLVYTPSGNVVQYKLLSSSGGETSETSLRTGHSYSAEIHDEELGVKVEPVQGWDVCRRTDWPEREECISGITVDQNEVSEMTMDTSDCEDNDNGHKENVKLHDRSHLHISNAEVQMSSGRILICQNSKIHFYTMNPLDTDEQNSTKEQTGGEIEVEKIPVHYVEIRRKDLLPVFDHFHRIQSDWIERGIFRGRSTVSSSKSYEAKENYFEESDISQSKSMSPRLVENSDVGSSKITYPSVNENENFATERGRFNLASHTVDQILLNKENASVLLKQSAVNGSAIEDSKFSNIVSSLTSGSHSAGGAIAKEVQSSTSNGTGKIVNISSNHFKLSTNTIEDSLVKASLDFEYFFEEPCKASASSECRELVGIITDVDSSNSPCDKEKFEEDCDNDKSEDDCDTDDMLGGVFAFSEEG
ncbi:autophagy-related protein 18h-like isoform X2 [Mangifera indica]|uniref:autophagy-related protein 18h-like isoform X2 n=1 Tax=Mangifera indica TaxID=29780 RepID=UPI001CFAE6F5|nr:autophagy-related protein 18h-like isoform X2 [Mangifera indica]